MTKEREALKLALEALVVAEAGLADIGDADRDPTDDLAWCEERAAQALAIPRFYFICHTQRTSEACTVRIECIKVFGGCVIECLWLTVLCAP